MLQCKLINHKTLKLFTKRYNPSNRLSGNAYAQLTALKLYFTVFLTKLFLYYQTLVCLKIKMRLLHTGRLCSKENDEIESLRNSMNLRLSHLALHYQLQWFGYPLLMQLEKWCASTSNITHFICSQNLKSIHFLYILTS